MDILGYEFELICNLSDKLERFNGHIFEYNPASNYNNSERLSLNSYGKLKFCRFKIPDNFKFSGVYCLVVDNEIVYIGECENLSQRFNVGYGNISPRNCFVNGQSTNCKINNFVLEAVKLDQSIFLMFYKTKDYKRVEYHLIRELRPRLNKKDNWNSGVEPRQEISSLVKFKESEKLYTGKLISVGHVKESKNIAVGKYDLLYQYLIMSNQFQITLSFNKIEEILGFKLPNSAYTYPAWWANGVASHSHAKSWGYAGYKVIEVEFGRHVIFKKC